jgi:hypothetical protein
MKKFMVVLLICLGLWPINVHAVEGEVPEEIPAEIVMNIVAKDMKINVGETKYLNYSIEGAEDFAYSVSFTSADTKIASVNEQGAVKGLSIGTTSVEVVAVFEDETLLPVSKSVSIEVIEKPAKLSFSKSDVSIIRDDTYTIEYTLETGTAGSDVIWESSEPLVASVVNGVVKAHKVGTAKIRARIGSVEAEMVVRVIVPLQRLEFNPKQVRLKVSQEIALPSLIFVPYDTTVKKKVTYSVDDESIAIISNDKLIGLKEGTTAVLAKIGNITAVLNVIVELDEAVSNNFVVDFDILSQNEEAMVLKSGSMDKYKVGKVDINLPVDAILAYMENREVTRLKLIFDDELAKDQFKLVNSILIPKDLFLLLGAQKLEIEIADSQGITWASYYFNARTKNDIDLKVVTTLIDSKSNLIVQTGGQTAYHLRFNETTFPSDTYVRLNTLLFNRIHSDYYFLYEKSYEKLTYTEQQAAPLDNFVRFLIEGDDYVVSFNRFASGQNKAMLHGLSGLVFVLLISIGYRSFKKILKR